MPLVIATVAESLGCTALGVLAIAAAAGVRWFCSNDAMLRMTSESRSTALWYRRRVRSKGREQWIEADMRYNRLVGRWVIPIVWALGGLYAFGAAIVVLGHP